MARLNLDEMQEIARVATVEALAGWEFSDELWEQVTLGAGLVAGNGDFILYVPADIPSEGQRIARTVVSREGAVLSVEIYEDVLSELGATKGE